jgi:uncharacterized protein with ParB-like and HNH nuclease domain
MIEPLKRLSLQQLNRPLDCIQIWGRDNRLLLDTPYQRGDVWGPVRQRNLIRSILMGIPIPSIITNDRSRSGTWPADEMWKFAVIDGKQRLTAILKFLNDELYVPAEWFLQDQVEWTTFMTVVKFSDLKIAQQRRIQNTPIIFSEGSLRTIEEEMEVFELVNYGGVPQGETDIP